MNLWYDQQMGLVFLLKDPADLVKEHLKVYLRIRPFSAPEMENGESQV